MVDLSDDDYDEIASKVVERLDPGRYGDRFVLSRRQVMSLAGVAGGGGVLAALGVDQASAQASDIASADTSDGQVGASGSPEDVVIDQLRDPGGDEVFNVDDTGAIDAQPREWAFDLINGGAPVTDGDAVDRQLWVIANGASDPALADDEDIIFEEES
jgi:hypothetical protein